MVSCQKGPTRHAYAWQLGPFWQDTIELPGNIYFCSNAICFPTTRACIRALGNESIPCLQTWTVTDVISSLLTFLKHFCQGKMRRHYYEKHNMSIWPFEKLCASAKVGDGWRGFTMTFASPSAQSKIILLVLRSRNSRQHLTNCCGFLLLYLNVYHNLSPICWCFTDKSTSTNIVSSIPIINYI